MKYIKRMTGRYVLAAMLFVALLALGDARPAQAAVKLNASSMNLCVGDRAKLELTGTSKKAKWKSANPSIVKVSSTGNIRAIQAGSTTVTATVGSSRYSCKIKVNKTFKVNQTTLTVKKNATVTAYLSVDGAIHASVADKKVCAVTFGEWDGDYMPLTIVPKKVGSTTITFSNTKNKEYCTLNVKVTALPSTAKFSTPVISTGSDWVIAGENTMNFTFQLDRTAKTTNFKIYNADGEVVRTINLGTVAAKKKKKVIWDGLDNEGRAVSGVFKYAVVADGNKTSGGQGVALAGSPFGKGDGTKDNPFLVSNPAELYLIKNYNGAYFAQDADIDFNYSMFVPLFDETAPFTGTYDGKYGTSAKRMINLCSSNSVFGCIGAEGTIKNVSMSDCVLNMSGSFLAYRNNGTIDNCSVSGKIYCNPGYQASMLVTYNQGLIRDCDVSGSLDMLTENVSTPMSFKAGGIALNNSGTIAQCTSSVIISQHVKIGTYVPDSVQEICVGGIVADNERSAIVTQCTFNGTIDAKVILPDNVKDVSEAQAAKIYSGYVAGSNNGYIGNCINASVGTYLSVQGMGTGTAQ